MGQGRLVFLLVLCGGSAQRRPNSGHLPTEGATPGRRKRGLGNEFVILRYDTMHGIVHVVFALGTSHRQPRGDALSPSPRVPGSSESGAFFEGALHAHIFRIRSRGHPVLPPLHLSLQGCVDVVILILHNGFAS